MKISRRKMVIIALLFPFTGLFVYINWPLASRKWDIHFDPVMINEKHKYLSQLRDRPIDPKEIRPNIIIIAADDLAKTDISLYGSPYIKTPAIDSIGTNGITFNAGLSSAPVCSPSRAGLLTGRYQNRFGLDSQPMRIYPFNKLVYYITKYFINTDDMSPVLYKNYPRKNQMNKQGLPPSEITLAEALGESGYETALMGKWHLGYGEGNHPNGMGFDHFYGFLEAFTLFDDPEDENIINYRHDLFSNKHIWRQKRKGPCAIMRNQEIIQETRYLTVAITDESLDFLDNHKDSHPDDPYFLYISYNAPHTPFQATLPYYNRFRNIEDENKRVYLAMIAQLDDEIQRVLDHVKESGEQNNTIIVFLSDNGGATYTGATDNAPLKGGKFSQFEGGINVPMMIQWPGSLPEGEVFEPAVSQLDLFPTLLSAAHISLPEDRELDGVDISPYLREQINGAPHKELYWRCDFSLCIRTEEWKLVKNNETGDAELYNLNTENGEHIDVKLDFPEIFEDLDKKLDNWNEELPPAAWPRVMNYTFHIDGKDYVFAI